MATDIRLKEGLREITDALVATYTDCRHINHLGHKPLPSREAVCDILADFMDILYPGYVRRQNLHIGNVEYHIGDLIDGLHDKLTQQIVRALRHEYHPTDPQAVAPEHRGEGGPVDLEALAQQKAIDMLRRLAEIRYVLEEDVESA